MPVVHIRGGSVNAGRATPKSLGYVATAVGNALGILPERVWCTFQELTESTVGARRPTDPGILYVDLLLKPRGESVERSVFEATMKAAAVSFQVPLEDVWGRKVILGSDTVFSGGRVT